MIVFPFAVMIGATPKLTVKELGGFLKVIVASAGAADQGRMDCLEDGVSAEMKSRGITLDGRSRIAFAANLVQVRTFNAVDKLIICTDKTYLKEGATIAIVREDGKPAIYIDIKRKKSFEEAGVTFSDTLLKMAKFV